MAVPIQVFPSRSSTIDSACVPASTADTPPGGWRPFQRTRPRRCQSRASWPSPASRALILRSGRPFERCGPSRRACATAGVARPDPDFAVRRVGDRGHERGSIARPRRCHQTSGAARLVPCPSTAKRIHPSRPRIIAVTSASGMVGGRTSRLEAPHRDSAAASVRRRGPEVAIGIRGNPAHDGAGRHRARRLHQAKRDAVETRRALSRRRNPQVSVPRLRDAVHRASGEATVRSPTRRGCTARRRARGRRARTGSAAPRPTHTDLQPPARLRQVLELLNDDLGLRERHAA